MLQFLHPCGLGASFAFLHLKGDSLSFGEGNTFVGDLSMALLSGVGSQPNGTIPDMLFMAFQGTFYIITAALITGAFVERIRFKTYLLFTLLWATLVYDPICHWVWGPDGWLGARGALDFAGGTVVHISSGVSALVCALVIGYMLAMFDVWTALAAAVSGLAKKVLAPFPCRPSKLRLLVLTAYCPGCT